jgi:hypothetical protein
MKALAIAPKDPRKTGIGVEYMTKKNVPPNTMSTEGTSKNGLSPPPEIIAPRIMPMPPIRPTIEAISIF